MSIPSFVTDKPYATTADFSAILKPKRVFSAETDVLLPKGTILHYCSMDNGKATFNVLSGAYVGRSVSIDVENLGMIEVTVVVIFVGNTLQ